ncbi:MAG: TonB-dependent receptor [Planctomycetota bacterium]|jgi:iron complex outermembrane receptor protein
MRTSRRAPRIAAGLATAAIAASGPGRFARAQDDAPELPEIVVTAERVERPAERVPMSVTAVTSAEFEDAGMADVGDVSEWVPDFTVVDWGSRRNTFVYVRGIGSSRQGESAVGVYVDDVPLLSNGVFMADLGDVERVEVLRGPQGTLFGRNTLGGVVNVVTKPLPAEAEGLVSASLGTDAWLEGRASFAGPLGREDLRLGLSAFGSRRDGFTTNDLTGETVDDRRATGGRLKLEWLPSDSLEVTLSADAESDRDGGYALTLLPQVRSNPYHVSHDYEGWEDRDVLGGSVRAKWSAAWGELTSVTAIRQWQLDSGVDLDFLPLDMMRSSWDEQQRQITQELRLASRGDAVGPQWLVGSAFFDDDTDEARVVDYGALAGALPAPYTRAPGDVDTIAVDHENWGIALFGNAVWPAGERLEVSGGLRWSSERKSVDVDAYSLNVVPATYRYAATEEFDELVPRAGLSFKVSEGSTAYVNVARGYRSGGFNGAFAPPGSEAFEPEHSMNYELGYKMKSTDGRARLSASAFYISWDDQQVVQYTAPPQTITTNAGESRSVGAEAEFAFRPVPGVELTAGVAYVDAAFEEYDDPVMAASYDGNAIPLAREYELDLAAKFRREIGADTRLFARVGVRAQGEFHWDSANAFREEPHEFVDVRLGIEHRRWDVTLWARNLLAEDYASIVFVQMGSAVGQAGDPRTVGLSVGARF